MRLDNNTLSVVLVLAIVVSVAVLFYNSGLMGITGAETTDTGTANFTIDDQVSILFIDDLTEFGTGTVTDGTDRAVLTSDNTAQVNATDWSTIDDPMILKNNGNIDANITLEAADTPDTWIGGDAGGGPGFEFKVADSTGNTSACTNPTASFSDLSTTEVQACENLTSTSAHDCIDINYKVIIPQDAIGVKQTTVTATASAYSA